MSKEECLYCSRQRTDTSPAQCGSCGASEWKSLVPLPSIYPGKVLQTDQPVYVPNLNSPFNPYSYQRYGKGW